MAKRFDFGKAILGFLGVLSLTAFSPTGEPRIASSNPPSTPEEYSHRLAGTVSTGQASDEEKVDFLSIRELYAQGNYPDTLKKVEQFKNKYRSSSFLGQAENITGLCYLLTKQPLEAISHFNLAIQATTSSNTKPYLEYNLAKAQFEAGLLNEAEHTLSQIDPLAFDQENQTKYQHLKSNIQLKKNHPIDSTQDILQPKEEPTKTEELEHPTDRAAIGVLLPLKGKFAKFGTRALQGIELALNLFDESKPDPGITLVIEDSGEEPEDAVKALNRLVTRHHVIAVIGPLLTKGIDSLTHRAQELKVPLLSLAKQAGPASDYVIPAGMTFQMQAFEIARHAIQKMNLRRFAILSPKDKLGDDFTQYFWDAVESLGGEITGIETYASGETDFRTAVDKLSGLYYTEARQTELNELARLREENHIQKKTRKTEQFFNLKPIVDYDAVFIPDEPKISSQILPTFAYRDIDNVQFLGPSAWNSLELSSRAQSAAEKAVFVDSFYSESKSPTVQNFIQGYQSIFNLPPTSIDALAYDAAQILQHALTSTGSDRTRDSVLKQLKTIENQNGITGKISFRDGQFYRDLNILTIHQGKIIEYGKTAQSQ